MKVIVYLQYGNVVQFKSKGGGWLIAVTMQLWITEKILSNLGIVGRKNDTGINNFFQFNLFIKR